VSDADVTTTSRFVLRPAPPVRAFLVSAVLVLAGAVLSAVARDASGIWLALALLVLLLGLVLAAIAAASMVRMRTFVDVDAQGYRITGPGIQKQGAWDDVTRVTTSGNGARLSLHHGEVGRTHIIAPSGQDEQMTALTDEVAKRLDANRGYGETMNVPLMHRP